MPAALPERSACFQFGNTPLPISNSIFTGGGGDALPAT